MKKISILFLLVCQCVFAFSQVINVSTATQLNNALANAQPGHVITLADGIYIRSGGFKVTAGINGTISKPIKLVGTSKAVISCNNLASGYGFSMLGNDYWILEGFTVRQSSKGIMLDYSNHNVLKNLRVVNSGGEAIHLRKFSSYNSVSGCFIDSTGRDAADAASGFAEGIYIGSAESNWATYTNSKPDTCNFNTITGNTFGDVVLSENIDIKEGTSYGVLSFNSFNGKGCNGNNSADSWIDMKGNYYSIECNSGINNHPTGDGLQTHVAVAGWGDYNTFSNNTLNVNASGYGINIVSTSSKGTAIHNKVCDNNVATLAGKGMTNVVAVSCTGGACANITSFDDNDVSKNALMVSPNPFEDEIKIYSSKLSISKVEVYDLEGKFILSQISHNPSSLVFNTSTLSKGMYLLKVEYLTGSIEMRKIVKK
jgi:hypothetical protein